MLAWHCRHYPLLQARDIYKLVHQGVFGPGHIIASAAQAKRMLGEEMAALEVRSPKSKARRGSEAMVEPIDPRGKLVRVNLRPMFGEGGRMKDDGGKRKARRGGADEEWLARALVESARRVRGDPKQMRRGLSAAIRWCRKNLPRQAVELERLAAQAGESSYPAFHHSPVYSRAYRPAYRVVLRTCRNPKVRLNHKGRTKREVRGEKLERRARSGTSDF